MLKCESVFAGRVCAHPVDVRKTFVIAGWDQLGEGPQDGRVGHSSRGGSPGVTGEGGGSIDRKKVRVHIVAARQRGRHESGAGLARRVGIVDDDARADAQGRVKEHLLAIGGTQEISTQTDVRVPEASGAKRRLTCALHPDGEYELHAGMIRQGPVRRINRRARARCESKSLAIGLRFVIVSVFWADSIRPSAMQFVDEVKIHVKAGDGGNGCVAFRREAHVPRGGPSGGDGGNGGDVILVVDPQLSTLLDFRYKRHYKAQRGEDGRGKDQYGKGGRDLILRVPVGTVVFDAETGALLADLDSRDGRVVVAKGGRGGRGNIHFKNPWNQAPRTAEPGTPGHACPLRLELKSIADVGLVGFPSVGKSTMISAISRARPKVAAYPFTTLQPNLGLVQLSDDRSLVVADIPGLIEGAADGVGLGHRFLRHVERTRVLLHLIEDSDMTGPDRDPLGDYEVLNRELARYSSELAAKPQIVAVNKVDLTETAERADELGRQFAERGIHLYRLSAATRAGLGEVLEALWQAVSASKSDDLRSAEAQLDVRADAMSVERPADRTEERAD